MDWNPTPQEESSAPDYYDPYEDWHAPIPRRRRPVGLIIGGLVAAMLMWEAFQRPPDGEGRFRLIAEDNIAYAYGGTDSQSYLEVEKWLDANPAIDTIVLRHVPGTEDMARNVDIARLIRERGIATHLENDSFIASGGVHLFLAGETRSMECGAAIGVHSWKSTDGSTPETLGFDPAEDYMTDFHTEMGVDPSFYAFSRDASPHEGIYILRPDEIVQYDLLSEPCEDVSLWAKLTG